jgi:hypothetical protein
MATGPTQHQIEDAARTVELAAADAREMFGLPTQPPDDARFETSWIVVVQPGWERMSIPHAAIEQLGGEAEALSSLPTLAENAAWAAAAGLVQDIRSAARVANAAASGAGPTSHARPGTLSRAIAHGIEAFRHLAIRGADGVDRLDATGHDANSSRKAASGLRRIALNAAHALDSLLGGDGSLTQEATARDVERHATRDRGRTLWDTSIPGPQDRTYGMHSDVQLVKLHAIALQQADLAHQAALTETTGTPAGMREEVLRGVSTFRADPVLTRALLEAGPSEIHIARTQMYKNIATGHEANASQIRAELRARSDMTMYRNRIEENIRRGTQRTGPASVIAAQAATQQLAATHPEAELSLR